MTRGLANLHKRKRVISDSESSDSDSDVTDNVLLYIPIKVDRYYRYLYFKDGPHADISLSIFYGEDRSFTQGCIFDVGPIIIEFLLLKDCSFTQIRHHSNSFRGSLNQDNTIITRIFVDRLTESQLFTSSGCIEFRRKSERFISKIGANFPDDNIIFYEKFDEGPNNLGNCFISVNSTLGW